MSEERRVVTILFSDVAGSTALAESSDPEDVRALLGRYYAIARDVIAEHGGTVEKFIGDSVMAVFGIPQAHGDDAERALAAALALREAVAREPQTASLTLRLGLNTGEVVAARSAEGGDFLVTGDAVNVAARLQQHAEPGSILVGERTRRAATGFRFGKEQRIEVKGKREPIGASALIERLAARKAPRAPFMGREHDLAQLDLVARRAFSERRAQLVTITAPAGTGKSRLVEEFVARAGGTAKVAVAQCLPYGSAVTFLPLRGLVRDLAGAEHEEETLPRLAAMFARAGHSAEDAQRLATLIGATLGDTTESERRDRDEVFNAWRLLIEAEAARGPLVVVFEDLHWATDTLLDLVEQVTMSRRGTPLVMFALARPELLDRRSGWGGGRRNFTSLGLEPLSDSETRALVSNLTGGIPDEIATRIVERAGGNPFFAGELVRAYDERKREGILDADIHLPDTVHATVLARIDKLPPQERTVLEYAAVAGRTARADAIHALLPDLEGGAIAGALDALADRDLLVAQGGGAYTFRHIVIREVAYATLPRAERVRAHLRLAAWFEAGDLAEVVAYHYRQAIALSPGQRLPGGVAAEKVAGALARAARAAANASAWVETAELLREAIRFAPPHEHIRLLELMGDSIQFGDDAMAGYVEAHERWAQTPGADPRTGARLLVKRLGVLGRWAGSLKRTIPPSEFDATAAEAERLLTQHPDEVIAAKVALARAFQRARFHLGADEAAAMVPGLEAAAALFAARGDAEGESEALDAICSVSQARGEWDAGIEVTRRRLANLPRLGLIERIDAWSMLLWAQVLAGRYEEAIANCRDAIRGRRAGEPEYAMGHCVAWAAYAARLCGAWDVTLEFGDALVAMREESQERMGRFTFPGWMAALHVAQARGDTTRAARLLSATIATAGFDHLTEPARSGWQALIHNDAEAAQRFLLAPLYVPDRKGEALAMLTIELQERVPVSVLDALEREAQVGHPPVLSMRVRLARALDAGPGELREAIAVLDAAHHVADAARAAALLAKRTEREDDRADARRRLEALGDQAYLQRLEEP